MDKGRVEGGVHQVKGTVEEAVGKVPGNANTPAKGAAEKTAAEVQNEVGSAKEPVRDSVKK
jgi:uncharacterized protein YjbJ (UPF0337 family)